MLELLLAADANIFNVFFFMNFHIFTILVLNYN